VPPERRRLPPGYTIVYPNRDKVASKVVRVIVALLLLISVVLILAVTIGGWSRLQGMKPVNFIWCALYVILAVFVLRWSRGMLPISAGLAILLLLLALIAGTGASGTSWFDRNAVGYGATHSLFGGNGFDPDTLGLLTLLIAPVQLLLIFFAMLGFAQSWNVEYEAPIDEVRRRRGRSGSPAAPAAA
jgi:hypothetical protein